MSIHMLETLINSDIQMDIMNKMFSYIYTSLLYQLPFCEIPFLSMQIKRRVDKNRTTRQIIYLRIAP